MFIQKDTPTQQVVGDIFTGGEPQNIDQLVAISDHIILGTVTKVLNNINHEEFVVQINKQYKGKAETKQIHVFESNGALTANQSYILFLNVTKSPYIPHLTYTSPVKEAILLIEEENVVHHSALLHSSITLNQLENLLDNSPGKNIVATSDITRGHATITQASLTQNELTEKADFVAHVVVTEKTIGNKYAQLVRFDFKNIYKNNTSIEINDLTPFIMPSSLELNEHYIVFLQYHDGAFYTVSMEGSTIAQSDELKWKEAMDLLNK